MFTNLVSNHHSENIIVNDLVQILKLKKNLMKEKLNQITKTQYSINFTNPLKNYKQPFQIHKSKKLRNIP